MSQAGRAIQERLKQAIPEPRIDLDYADGWTLLIATILSAQSTDQTVNRVTPDLFSRWPTPEALAGAPISEVEDVVRSTGFFRNKAKAITGAPKKIVEDFDCEMPTTMEELTSLPGVARKTANIVLGTVYRIPAGIAVDTHVGRVAQRLGLSSEKKPDKVEKDLCGLFPRKTWPDMTLRLVLHGRYVCKARGPRCDACPLNELCPNREGDPEGDLAERIELARGLVGSARTEAGAQGRGSPVGGAGAAGA